MNSKSFVAAAAALSLFHGASAGVARRWGSPAGPFCTDFTPFVYAGCFSDPSSPLALPFSSDIDTQNMTVETCVSFCKGNGYRYAGLEYYGECFCGASVAGTQIAESNCNFPCTGNKSEACGGNDILSVYQDPTFTNQSLATVSDYKLTGCYTDSGTNGRTLVYRQDALSTATLTVEKCLLSCKTAGYPMAGVEFGSECYCGVVLGNGTLPVDNSLCNMPCNGNAAETCGGPALLNLYVALDLESSQPCNFGPPASPSSTTSTTKSTTTTSPPTTSTTTTTSKTTTSPALCTATLPPTCEYSCGSWCSSPLPSWSSSSDCQVAASSCFLQIAGCFSNAKFPDSLKCLDFSSWCSNVASYCSSSSCQGGKCSNGDCKNKYPPAPPSNGPSTTVYPCPVTTKITTTAKPTTTSCSTVPVPTSSNICKQPNNPSKGYSSNSPCGGIQLPCLTCNNIKSDYDSGSCFKLYTNKDSSQCSSYKKPSISQGCKDACLAQYNSCIGTYAESCRSSNSNWWKEKKRSADANANADASPNPDWWSWYTNGDTYSSATQKCKNQYSDCLSTNSGVSTGNRCSSWNSGWF